MHLTTYTDYALRLLIYLTMTRNRLVTIAEVSQAYGISRNHLLKVQNRLTSLGLIEAVRGRSGGVRLIETPEKIRVGDLVRKLETKMALVECFDAATDTCRITPVCGLKPILATAQAAFITSLNTVTLADVVKKKSGLERKLLPKTVGRDSSDGDP